MDRLFFSLWPFAIKIANVGSKVYQLLTKPFQNCPKIFEILPKRRIFAKSGHTGWVLHECKK